MWAGPAEQRLRMRTSAGARVRAPSGVSNTQALTCGAVSSKNGG